MASSDALPNNVHDDLDASSSSLEEGEIRSPEKERRYLDSISAQNLSLEKCGISPISKLEEAGSPEKMRLSPLPKLEASASRSRSPLASLEMRKRCLSPSQGYEHLSPMSAEPPMKTLHLSPSRQFLISNPLKKYSPKFSSKSAEPPKKKTLHLSPSRQLVESDYFNNYSPKFSPRRDDYKNLDQKEKKGKRRSVMLAGLYGQKRIESIKRKQAEGCKLLTEVVESPSAQHNGVFKFEDESEVNVPAQPTKSTGVDRRRSILQAKPYTQSRIKSAKEKESKGMPLSAILQSPSAKANGAAVSPYKNRIAASIYNNNNNNDTA